MGKINRIVIFALSVCLVGPLLTLSARAGIIKGEEDSIKTTIRSYYDAVYRSRQNLEIEDIGMFYKGTPTTNQNLQGEIDKQEIEVHQLQAYNLGYIDYKVLLDFISIDIDLGKGRATVHLVEGWDVIFEGYEPTVTSMRNTEHALYFVKVDKEWKIEQDQYNDYLWRYLRKVNLSKDEVLNNINSMAEQLRTIRANQVDSQFVGELLANSIGCSFPYDRAGAYTYAETWALSRNPNYYDYTGEGGDCTNFVSQAIHEGGKAPMVGAGTYGWY